MSTNKIQVAINGKTISSKPIERVLVRGEKDSNVIVFTLNRIWNGIDISASGTAYQVLGRNQKGEPSVDMLIKRDGPTSDTFTLTWTVSSRFTNSPGVLDIWISAIRGTSGFDFNWNTNPVRLYVSDGYVIGDYDTYDSLTRQLLDAIAVLVVSAQDIEYNASRSAAAALQSQNAAKSSEIAAKASEINSKGSEIEAKKSQIAAKKSEINSANSAANALISELNSKDNAASAAASIELASEYASRAHQSAAESSGYKQAAKDAADRAENAASYAENSAISAQNSANDAYQAVIDAGNAILLQNLIAIDPTTGKRDTVQNIVNNLFRQLATGAITPEEFDALNLDPVVFDAMNIDPFQFDTIGKKILTGGL